MTTRKKPTAAVASFVSGFALCALAAASADAADLPANAPADLPMAAPEPFPHWFVRVGVLGVVDQSSSKVYVQPTVGIFGVGPQFQLPGRGESFSNLLTLSVQAGYFLTPNLSLDLAGGFPVWQTTRITGYSATGPASGTVLTKTLPASVPITAVYHFTQLGALQPYLGVGFAPVFVFATRDAYAVGTSTRPSIAAILQGGFDYMFNRNWGIFFDAKKYFDRSIGTATGLNVGPPVGVIHAAATGVTIAQPWVFATGLTYRF